MTEEERRAWIRMLLVLLLAAGVRMAWDARTGRAATPGLERDAMAALDTVDELAAEAARRRRPLAPGERLDPNRADPVDLDRLPGVGPATATAIVETRADAPFIRPEDLLRVSGIGPATLEKLRPYLSLEPAWRRSSASSGEVRVGSTSMAADGMETWRVDINHADSVELQVLPGIGPALAGRIVRARLRNGPFRGASMTLPESQGSAQPP